MKQFIQCPCGSVELATLGENDLVHLNHIHWCNKCGFYITHNYWNPVKALSIKQPWSWLIVNSYKDIENRDTLKNFRGTFLIHAGMSYDYDWTLKFNKNISPELFWKNVKLIQQNKKLFQSGGIIGYAEIYDCVTESDSPWFVGKNGLMIRNAKPLPFTPCKGKLSFFYPEID